MSRQGKIAGWVSGLFLLLWWVWWSGVVVDFSNKLNKEFNLRTQWSGRMFAPGGMIFSQSLSPEVEKHILVYFKRSSINKGNLREKQCAVYRMRN
jgi:hypothetical protein